MSIIYGYATPYDIEELIELRTAYLLDDFGSISQQDHASIVRELPAYLKRHMGHDLSIHVARDGGRIIACAWLLQVEKPPSPRFAHGKTGILFNVYTARSHRKQGHARTVMRHLLEEARKLELDVIELHATDQGYPLYLSLGFADDSTTHKAMRFVLPQAQPPR